ncbi:transcription coactivator [Raphanus sativus]|nr:transcription coactivator [Raphanus sativus]KAJ4913039.1 transcription coactivator [Raphanus sativus]
MDGLKVLASGFQIDEKVKIEKLVTSMEGVLVSRTSSDVNFVIVKNVLAAKYKYIGDFLRTEAFEREERFTMQYAPLWALYVQKKPVVALSWLHQCWNEHSIV